MKLSDLHRVIQLVRINKQWDFQLETRPSWLQTFLFLSTIAIGLPSSSAVKNLPAMQETQEMSSLDWDDPLEKEMATHSSIFTGKISWKE